MIKVASDCHPSRFYLVFVLTVASSRRDQLPAIMFYHSDDLADFHKPLKVAVAYLPPAFHTAARPSISIIHNCLIPINPISVSSSRRWHTANAVLLLLAAMFACTRNQIRHWESGVTLAHRAVTVTRDNYTMHYSLAWNLATASDPALRDPDEAVSLARRACELTGHGKPELLDTLAAAFAAAGRFDEAEKTAEKAEKLAEAAGSEALAREIRSHLLRN